jgi:dihydrofolate synthase/folylpolyglutamate synthase
VRFAEALAELDGRQPERMVPDLDRITALTELLGDPQRTYPTVHVTGTNGKTTTTQVVTALACAHGLVAGAYTSPHLASVTERLAVCGEAIDEEEFGEAYERLLPYLQAVEARSGERVTYFESLTALAYLWFADRPVGLGVFEVGMGGTWDATNLVAGDVAIICPIGLDHPELGSTVAEVAREKAGIVKPGKVAVVREQPAEALDVIDGRAGEVGARVLLEGRDFGLAGRTPAIGGQVLDVRGLHAAYEGFVLPLFGDHAGRNAAAAIVALEALLDRALSEEAVRSALAAVAVPGRLEVVGRHPLVVLDGAHNPAGAGALAAALAESFTWQRLHLVIGVSANKDIDGVVAALAPLADRVYAARHASPRSAEAERVAEASANVGLPVEAFGAVAEALAAARESAVPEDLILVTGSLYTVADARGVLVP